MGRKKCVPEVIEVERDRRQSLVQPPYTGGGRRGLKSNQISVFPLFPEILWVSLFTCLLNPLSSPLAFSKLNTRRKSFLAQPLKHKMMGRREEPRKPAGGRRHEGGGEWGE